MVLEKKQATEELLGGLFAHSNNDTPSGENFSQANLSTILEEVSKDQKLKDDSIDLKVKTRIADAESLFSKLDFEKLKAKVSIVEKDYFDVLRTELDQQDEEILDQSALIPEPEINLRFSDPLTDKRMWNLEKIIDICKVDFGYSAQSKPPEHPTLGNKKDEPLPTQKTHGQARLLPKGRHITARPQPYDRECQLRDVRLECAIAAPCF